MAVTPRPETRAARPLRDLLGLYLLGAIVHGAWAATIPVPEEVDAAYYRLVARNLATGRGPVTDAVWQLAVVPSRLPAPADLHWMPLPSRVLVPGVWAWPAHGDRLVTVLLAAAWAPLAWALARRLGAGRWTAVGAGVLAALAPAYARRMDSPDSIALYGALGALAWLALARERWPAVALLAALAALTRNDGFLLGPCLALGLRGGRALAVAAAGPAAAAAWTLRSVLLAEPGYLAARQGLANATDKLALFGQEVASLGVPERLAFLLEQGLPALVFVWLVVLPLPASVAVWRHGASRWMHGALAYWFAAPIVAALLAPAVATYGSVFRSTAAVFPLACAVAALALVDLGRWSHARRGYPVAFLPLLLGGVVAGFTLAAGPASMLGKRPPVEPRECRHLDGVPAGEAVFSSHPLFVADLCGRPAVLLVRGLPAARVRELKGRFDVRWAFVAREDDPMEWALRAEDVPSVLGGWTGQGERLWRE